MSDASPDHAFDDAKFRQVLGHFPTGVTVITSTGPDGPLGFAVGSFASVSLSPPQVLFCAGQHSSTWPKIRESGMFCVNVLADDQEDVCRVFAGKSTEKFGEIGWKHSANGCPRIDGALAFIDCVIEQVVPSGDHDVVIGSVTDLDVLQESGPLLFYRGGYGRFGI